MVVLICYSSFSRSEAGGLKTENSPGYTLRPSFQQRKQCQQEGSAGKGALLPSLETSAHDQNPHGESRESTLANCPDCSATLFPPQSKFRHIINQ